MNRPSDQAVDLLRGSVGGFFCNTRRGPGCCEVCTGPAVGTHCHQCRVARDGHGVALADLVLPLAYAKAGIGHQSEHHMFSYKQGVPQCVRDLRLMVRVAAAGHGACAAARFGPWEVLTFVPSARRPGTGHPVRELAEQVLGPHPHLGRVLLDIGPGFHAEPSRAVRWDRFAVPRSSASLVAGRHVLIVDDTWVSGGKAQSAALALRSADAATITVLCVARWLRHDWNDHRQLIESLDEPYDPTRCPVTGGGCP